MHNNVGKKIKRRAKGVFVGGTITAIIASVILLLNKNILVGFLVLFLGPVAALIFSWLVYEFGEIIDK